MGNYLLCIAIDAAAPVIVGIVRPGFIFVICCRIFAFADGACACIPAAHAGTGFRLGVAGIALAGAGVGFVSIGHPIVPVVIQCVHFLIGYVIAAGAGIVGAPALFRAGGGFHLVMTLQIVVVRICIAAFKSARRLVAAVGTDLVIHGRRYAGGLGLQIPVVGLFHERMGSSAPRFITVATGAPVLVGIARPGAVKPVACRVSSVALVAPARFPAAHAGAISRFCVAVDTETGVGAVAIGATEHPFVLVRVCAAIFAIAFPAPGGVCAGGLPNVAVFHLYMAGVALAGMGVGFISVGCPCAPVMTQLVNRTALSAGGRFGAGRCAEGTILRFGV